MLAYMLDADEDLSLLQDAVSKRLLPPNQIEAQQKLLKRMLATLHDGGFITLDPPPPASKPSNQIAEQEEQEDASPDNPADLLASLSLGTGIGGGVPQAKHPEENKSKTKPQKADDASTGSTRLADYEPKTGVATDKLDQLLIFRAVNPLYGSFLLDHLGLADEIEQLQVLESLLEMPGSVARRVRVPQPDRLPPGALALDVVDPELIQRGLATQEELYPQNQDDLPAHERLYPPPLADKLAMLFEGSVDCTGHNPVRAVWAAGPLLFDFNGDFHAFISARELGYQEGVVFRHFLRLILLCDEFAQLTPSGLLKNAWQDRLYGWADQLTETCRAVDAQSTDQMLTESLANKG
ncbi:MAG: hypothetical protein AAF085_08350 [Planctomycetota bacterium]